MIEQQFVMFSTNTGAEYSPRTLTQPQYRLYLRAFVELVIGRSGVGTFFFGNRSDVDIATPQPDEINYLHPKYETQTE